MSIRTLSVFFSSRIPMLIRRHSEWIIEAIVELIPRILNLGRAHCPFDWQLLHLLKSKALSLDAVSSFLIRVSIFWVVLLPDIGRLEIVEIGVFIAYVDCLGSHIKDRPVFSRC